MLCSAFDNDSHSVTLDLLTSEDLDALRQASGVQPSAPKTETSNGIRSKRYLILTYHGEFDKVHYPMALTFSDVEDAGELKRTIVKLRDEIEQLRRSPMNPQSLHELERLVMASQSERDALARELNDYSIENDRLTALVETLKAENHSLRLRNEKLTNTRRSEHASTHTPTSGLRRTFSAVPSPLHRKSAQANSRVSSRATSPMNSARGTTSKSPRISRLNGSTTAGGRKSMSTKSPRVRSIPGLPPGYQSPYSQIHARSPIGSVRSIPSSPKNANLISSPSRRSSYADENSKSKNLKVRNVDMVEPSRGASLSEVDARLQALQNFLRNQKMRSG